MFFFLTTEPKEVPEEHFVDLPVQQNYLINRLHFVLDPQNGIFFNYYTILGINENHPDSLFIWSRGHL